MEEIDLTKKRKIHFIGIGGISMSAIAKILLHQGYIVSGSDFKENEILDELRSLGATIYVGHRPVNVAPDTDLVVYTAAIHPDNPEMLRAGELGIPIKSRAEFLGGLMKDYRSAVCVAGTHGKTTTTSLLARVLIDAETDPTITIGGNVPFLNGTLRIGSKDMFLAEACEYTNSFLSFAPTLAVILNVKADHLDFFKDLDDIRASFKQFADLLPASGTLVINGEIEDLSYFTDDLKADFVTFGLADNLDYSAQNISYDEFACPSFDILKKGTPIGHAALHIPGEHNIYNTLAAVAAADSLGISPEISVPAVNSFSGVNRRFEKKGVVGGVEIIDDYAHHPDEIRATLSAAQKYPHKKLWCVFQPHTYTRTKLLLDEFADSLSAADAIVLADIYAAREKNTLGISSADLADKIRAMGKEVYYYPTFDDIENFLLENLVNGDVLITMGAGDVVNIGEKLLGK